LLWLPSSLRQPPERFVVYWPGLTLHRPGAHCPVKVDDQVVGILQTSADAHDAFASPLPDASLLSIRQLGGGVDVDVQIGGAVEYQVAGMAQGDGLGEEADLFLECGGCPQALFQLEGKHTATGRHLRLAR
jgi:hypothetical protein